MKKPNELEAYFNIKLNNQQLLLECLTHSSFSNENGLSYSNERLEFVGDAVVDLLVGKYLYLHFPNLQEGELTKRRAQAVCEASLASYARVFNLGDYLFLGKGEEKSGARSRNAILADTFEAFIGAVFIDLGINYCESILRKIAYPNLNFSNDEVIDYKSQLQELVQSDKRTLEYQIISETGPSHDKLFVVKVILDDNITFGKGEGKSKKEAEHNAAKDALSKLVKK